MARSKKQVVMYKGHRHEVMGTMTQPSNLGTGKLYRLRSLWERGPAFYANAADCQPTK